MTYRKDIQILRGIAILFVLLFHLEFPGLEGGFLGVDIFFVISGFLMAIFYSPKNKKQFFERRARRILPAYFLTVFVTLIACLFLTIPNELFNVVKQSYFSSFLIPNVGFWLENSYFSKTLFKPLLHLWSLGVEIQFYLLIPLIFCIFKKSKVFLLITSIVSLVLCFLIVQVSPKTSFFMVPLRFWEFMIGFYVAKKMTKNGEIIDKNALFSSLSLAFLISAPFFGINGSSLSFVNGHPGIIALSICFSAAILLRYGIPDVLVQSKIGSALELLGTYSYSIYLVHFPVITLFLYKPFNGTTLHSNNIYETLTIIVVVTILSFLMYRYVEKPFKKSHFPWVTTLIKSQVAIVVLAFSLSNISPLFYSGRENLIFNAWYDKATYRCGKISRILHPTEITCSLFKGTNPQARVLLVGDSHADSIKTYFTEVAKDFNVSVRFMVPNKPLLSEKYNPNVIIREAIKKHITHITLHFSPGSIDVRTIIKLVELAGENNIDVSYLEPVPTWKNLHIPQLLFNNLKNGIKLPKQNIDNYYHSNKSYLDEISKIENNNFKSYKTAEFLCNEICLIKDEEGRPLYFDGSHLTLTGSKYLLNVFKDVLRTVSKTGPPLLPEKSLEKYTNSSRLVSQNH